MNILVSDINVVGETESTQFELLNQGTTNALLFLSNVGSNTINYRFQEFVSATQTWTNLVPNVDDDLYGTLIAGQTRSVKLEASNPQIRLVGNASGGSSLWFSVNRFSVRGNGGRLPILNF